MRIFEVGGSLRDEQIGVVNKDFDFAVEMTEFIGQPIDEAFSTMRNILTDAGFKIFVEAEQFCTIRARFPVGHPHEKQVGDFVLCREDGPSSDGRRPDFVQTADIEADLRRRDFTVNALARDIEDGVLIDPFGGIKDLNDRTLRFVGDPMERIMEDGLRVLRGIRFTVTKGFWMETETRKAICSPEAARMLEGVASDRKREELSKMFTHDSIASVNMIASLPARTTEAIFHGGVRLDATQKA